MERFNHVELVFPILMYILIKLNNRTLIINVNFHVFYIVSLSLGNYLFYQYFFKTKQLNNKFTIFTKTQQLENSYLYDFKRFIDLINCYNTITPVLPPF